MSTELTWQTVSSSIDETLRLAEEVGRKLRGGETIELVSDLGGGKTTFVRGLASGLGSRDPVSSPSFTLSNQYQADELTLYHFDLYRLHEPGVMRDALAEAVDDPKAVIVVEWANIVDDVLPAARLAVTIKTTGEVSRKLEFKYPEALKHLLPINT